MKITYLSLCALLCIFFAQGTYSFVIVWDLGDTLFSRNKLNEAQAVGFLNGLRFFVRHGKETANVMRRSMWRVMHEYGTSCIVDPEPPLDPAGEQQPDLMSNWFSGNMTSAEIKSVVLSLVEEHEGFSDALHKEMVKNVFQWMFTPELYAAAWQPVAPLVAILERCAARGYKQMVLSNADADTFTCMYENPDNVVVFKHFAPSDIVVSAVVKDIKPHASLFRILIQKAGVPAHRIILIDDQEENCTKARLLGMKAIHVKKGDAAQVERELRQLGVAL